MGGYRLIIIAVLAAVFLCVAPVWADDAVNKSPVDYQSSLILKDTFKVDSKGFNIIEDITHYLGSFPLREQDGFLVIDIKAPQTTEQFTKITQAYSAQDLQFVLIALGLAKDVETSWTTNEVQMLMMTALSFAAEKYKVPVQPMVSMEQTAQKVLMVSPDDQATLDTINYTHHYVSKLSKTEASQELKPIDYYTKIRLQLTNDFHQLTSALRQAGIDTIVVDGYANGREGYSESMIGQTILTDQQKAMFADDSTGPLSFRQYISDHLEPDLAKQGMTTSVLEGTSFDGCAINVGEKVVWIGQQQGVTLPIRLNNGIKELTGKIPVPVELNDNQTMATSFRELPNGEILFVKDNLSTGFIDRLRNTYKGAFAERLIEVNTTDAIALDMIAVGYDLFVPAHMSDALELNLNTKGYRIHKLDLLSNYKTNFSCRARVLN